MMEIQGTLEIIKSYAAEYFGSKYTVFAEINQHNWKAILENNYDLFFLEQVLEFVNNEKVISYIKNLNENYFLERPVIKHTFEDKLVPIGYSIDFSSFGPVKRSVLY